MRHHVLIIMPWIDLEDQFSDLIMSFSAYAPAPDLPTLPPDGYTRRQRSLTPWSRSTAVLSPPES